jgi:hypothetical protein
MLRALFCERVACKCIKPYVPKHVDRILGCSTAFSVEHSSGVRIESTVVS